MTTNGLTIYNKELIEYSAEYSLNTSTKKTLFAKAIPTPNSTAYMSNILICEEWDLGDEHKESSIILGSDDAMEFCNNLMHAKNGYSSKNAFCTTLGTGTKVLYNLAFSEFETPNINYPCVSINITDSLNGNSINYSILIPMTLIKDVCDNIMKAVDQSIDILNCNRNLEKQMTTLKNDMKAEKVHELYFELYDPEPKMYKKSEINGEYWPKIYKITARDKESKPLYSFLRIMNLTCVPMVDYRDYGKEFLCCPFVYSDEMIEMGKEFVKKKEGDMQTTVDKKMNKGS
jgi:hypothetical protein